MASVKTGITPVLDYPRRSHDRKVVIRLPNGRSLASRISDRSRGAPPTALVIFPIISVQLGAAVAKSLFDSLGPGGTVFLRIAFAALVLFLLVRPKLGGHDRAGYLVAGLFGLALAGMNFSLYLAFDRIPLGIAVTLEFVGPLGVAMLSSNITYSLDPEALRKLPARIFGVLGERLEMRAVAAILLVTIAAAGASLSGGRDRG